MVIWGKIVLRVSCLGLLSCVPFTTAGIAQTRVHVQQGLLEGSTTGNITVFKGIPFAAPPIGDLRWRAPQDGKSWEGVRPAISFPVACEQDLVRTRGPWTEEFMPQGAASEDCLYLNVWTPKAESKGAAAFPVYVFIHGGGFREGATSIGVYDGASLARQGVVVVTIQYRLGIYGFFAHPELTAESPNHASGNYGLLDCEAALRWIKQNIAAFGGDPRKVTVGGQSAGSILVHALLASPLSRGLLQGAIAESGSSVGPPRESLAAAEKEGAAFAAGKGVKSLAELRALPAEQLLPSSPGATATRFATIVDGWSQPEDPNAAIAAGHALDVPVLTGMQADEGSFPGPYGHTSVTQLKQTSLKTYGASEPRFEALYPFSDDASASAQSKAAARDQGLASMAQWAALTANHNHSGVYTYYWAHAIPWPEHPEYGAFHSSNVPYEFDNLKVLHRPFTAEDNALATEVSSWWVNFIRTGSPNGKGLPQWNAFEPSNPQTMQIDTGAHMRPLMSPERLVFWRSMLEAASQPGRGN